MKFTKDNNIVLHEHKAKSDFSLHNNKNRERSQKDAFVEGFWGTLKGDLLEATNKSSGWEKCPARQKETQKFCTKKAWLILQSQCKGMLEIIFKSMNDTNWVKSHCRFLKQSVSNNLFLLKYQKSVL